LREKLGGKGAGLVEMRQQLGLPVPPGFVLGTALCRQFLSAGWPAGLDVAIKDQLHVLERTTGRRFGDPACPLFVSVRSGAPISMPGMMDTILNLGANRDTINGLARQTGDERFALDTWSRFCRMYAAIVLGVSREALGDSPSNTSTAAMLRADVAAVQALCARLNRPIPDDPSTQLRAAIEAVFCSSRSERARAYLAREGIREDVPSAVIVQAMIFGNSGASSGTGVAFSRNPSTGTSEPYGDFLSNAQGEEVVAGIRLSKSLAAMQEVVPQAYRDLLLMLGRLEQHYRDLCDVEFTVENGQLFVLQVRIGKRSAIAAARIAVAMANEGLISHAEAVHRLSRQQLLQLRSTAQVRRDAVPIAYGVGASPGVVSGLVCFDPDRVARLAENGQRVILARPTTSPDDVHGMARAAGIITSTGGMVSHAALVARGWGIAAICGVEPLTFAPAPRVAGLELREGDILTIDGDTGAIYRDNCVETASQEPTELETLREWASELGTELGAPVVPAAAEGDRRDPNTSTPSSAGEIDGFAVLRALSLLGFASHERLAVALATSAEAVRRILETLPAGSVDVVPRGLNVGAPGRTWLQATLTAERERVDRSTAEQLYRAFMTLDGRFKSLVMDWQVRVVNGQRVANDHSDPAYDAAIGERLATFHQDAMLLVPDIVALTARLRPFGIRLARAAAAISAGDRSMIASPLKDSYHTVWFELHEELIHLAGRDRASEEAKAHDTI
jgi:pyruvate,orthophosphate dikinase